MSKFRVDDTGRSGECGYLNRLRVFI